MKESVRKFLQKVVGEGGLRLSSTAFVLLLARTLGPENFGRYSSAFAFASMTIVLVDLGTNAILMREIARDPAQKNHLASVSHLLKIAAALGAWILLVAATFLFRLNGEQRFLTLCLAVVVIGQTLTEYFSALLNGIEEMGWEAILKSFCRLLSLSFGFAALALHQPLHSIVACLALGSFAGYLLAVAIVRRRFKSFGFRFDKPLLVSLVKSSAPLFVSILFLILYDSQDVLLLNYYHFPQKTIGWFSAAMKVMDVLRVYPILVMTVFFPTLSKLHQIDLAAFRAKYRRLLIFMGASLVLMAGVLYLLAPWMIDILYKSDFAPAAVLLRFLLPSLVLLGMNQVQSYSIIALNREKALFPAAISACIGNILLAILLLPHFGVPGVCYALFGSEVLFFFMLRKDISRAIPS